MTTNKTQTDAFLVNEMTVKYDELAKQYLTLAKRYEKVNKLYHDQMVLAAQRYFEQVTEITDLVALDVCFFDNGLVPTGFSEIGEPLWDSREVEQLMKSLPTSHRLTLVN